MKPYVRQRSFTKREEAIHSLTHGLGALAGVFLLIILIMRVWGGGILYTGAAIIYGVSIIVLYSASFAYHASSYAYEDGRDSSLRDFFKKCDHSIIFFLILGTYTPACAVLGGALGAVLFGIVASCSVLGVVLHIISVEKYKKISEILYLIAGWTIAPAIIPFYRVVGFSGILYLVLGGILYTVGVIFYKLEKKMYFHTIWHFFVLAGTAMHFILVYFYCF